MITQSDAYQRLFAEQTRAFARIRGLRKAFALIHHACAGALSQQLADKATAYVSLDPEATFDAMGKRIATDEAIALAWRESLAKLLEDSDAELPIV